MYPRDVFISHAGEDKENYARPLDRALNHLGVSTWLDEAVIDDGQSLLDSVGQGLSKATLIVLLITANFLGKKWPETELRNALNQEISSGMTRIIPVIDITREQFVEHYPLLQDKLYRRWNGNVGKLANDLRIRLERIVSDWHYGIHPESYTGPIWTRITPDPRNYGAAHSVTIIWGQYIFRREFSIGEEPISLRHHKIYNDSIPLQVHISPEAFVTVGQGPAPDADSYLIDEGWTRLAGAPIQ